MTDSKRISVATLEAVEKIECLRYLENGISLRMIVVDYMGVEIDTPEDLDYLRRLWTAVYQGYPPEVEDYFSWLIRNPR